MKSLLFALWLGLVGPSFAAGPDPSTIVGPPAGATLEGDALNEATNRVSKHMRCPVCQGLSVADSPSESARAMKEEVRALVAQGYDDEQVIAYFEASYGEFIRLEPTTEGWNLLVWVLPLVVLGGGGIAAVWTARGWSRSGAAGGAAEPAIEIPPELEPYLERVRADVGRAQ